MSIEALTPEVLLYAYTDGAFPMASPDEDNEIYWFSPDPRAVIPLDTFHVSRNLRRLVRQGRFEVWLDRHFEGTIRACAQRRDTWISEEIITAYCRLYQLGFAHSVECYLGDDLAGGLYGVAIGGAFFGESMFHNVRDASKVALVHLVEHLRERGFTLLDTQFTTPHLEQFGVVEIPRNVYMRRLKAALKLPVDW